MDNNFKGDEIQESFNEELAQPAKIEKVTLEEIKKDKMDDLVDRIMQKILDIK